MEEPACIVVLITMPDSQEAQQLSHMLLEQKKAACVNIIAGVNSRFWWQGQLDSAEESLLIVKTKASLLPELIKLVKRAHSYEVPEIIALPVIGGNQDYLEWIEGSVS